MALRDRADEKWNQRKARLDQLIVELRKYILAKLAVCGHKQWEPGGLHRDQHIGPQISAMSKHATTSPFMFNDDHDVELLRILDLCCGHSAVAKYYLNHNAYKNKSVNVMVVDIRKELYDMLKEQFSEEQLASVEIVVDDLTHATRATLEALVQEHWGCSLDQVHHIHWSPPCTTYSGIQKGKSVHRPYNDDGVPGEISQIAKLHDELVNNLACVLDEIAQSYRERNV